MQLHSATYPSTRRAGPRAALRVLALLVTLLPLWGTASVVCAAQEQEWEIGSEDVWIEDDSGGADAVDEAEEWAKDGDGHEVLVFHAMASRSYLEQLLDEINRRRSAAGTPPLAFVSSEANAALDRHAAELTATMLASGVCGHGVGDPPRFGWDYVADAGVDAEGAGEVIACPGGDGFWTAARVADGWWGSPFHARVLYDDSSANALACGTYGPQNGGRAYQTILCVTLRA